MNFRLNAPLGVAFLLISAGPALGRQVVYNGKTETVSVAVGSPTIIRFEKPVKTVTNATQFAIRPASEDSPDYATLLIESRSAKAVGFVTFILADGTIVRTKLVASAKGTSDGADSIYDFKTDQLTGESAGTGTAQAPEVKAIDLMKAMIRGDKVMGYEVREVAKSVQTGTANVSAELAIIYTGDEFNGYVFRLTNQSSDKTYQIDIRKLRLGEPSLAILSQIDRKVLVAGEQGKKETYVRIVARRGSVYRHIVLPIAVIKKNKGGAHDE